MSASALQRAASVIGAISGGAGGGSGRSTPTPPAPAATLSRSTSVRNYAQPGATGGAVGGGTAAAAAAQAGPHSLSLKVMRISAPALVRGQDRAYFEVPDEAFPASSEGAALSVGRAKASALAQDISSAEAGEMQRLYAAMAPTSRRDTEGSQGEVPSQSNIAAVERALRAAATSDMLSNQALVGPSPQDAALRDWPTSDVLVLPSSFGTIYLGEAFQAYICLNNESGEPVKDASLVVEIQQAEKEDESDARSVASGSSSNPSTLLARVSTGPPTPHEVGANKAEGESSAEQDFENSLLQPQAKLETTVRHDMRKPGGYVLGCTVSYQAWLPAPRMSNGPYDQTQGPAQGQWVERSFRKSYRFAVPTCPLTVRSKAHTFFVNPPSGSASVDGAGRPAASSADAILLEVQVRNDSPRSLVLERASLDSNLRALGIGQGADLSAVGLGRPFAGWNWESLDRPWLGYDALKVEAGSEQAGSQAMSRRHFDLGLGAANGSKTAIGLWDDENQWILPGDVRQFIFKLTPALTSTGDDEASKSDAASASSFLRRLAFPDAALPTSPHYPHNTPPIQQAKALPPAPGGVSPTPSTPLRPTSRASARFTSSASLLMIPLGKLDVAWRMAGAGGEPGRLQTSMLFWRREQVREVAAEGGETSPGLARNKSPPPPSSPYKTYQPRSWRDSFQQRA